MGCAGSRNDRGSSTRSRGSCQSSQSDWCPRSENCGIFDSLHHMPQYEMPQQAGCCQCGAKPQRSPGCCYCCAEQPRKQPTTSGCCYCGANQQQRTDDCDEERPERSSCCKSSKKQRRRRSYTTIQRTQKETTYAQLVIPIRACPCADANTEENRSCGSLE